jgi:signal recognition particle receptor subunit beta
MAPTGSLDARVDHVVKLLVTGPFNAGKTTLISAVSQTPVVDTDVATTGDEAATKARTTVAMDFGTYTVVDDDGRIDLLLFGTPGQPRFGFMTDVMKGDVDAVISVVDGSDDATHPEAGASMRALLHDLHVPLVVAVNRCDDLDSADLIARQLGALASEAVLPCQLIDPESSRSVVVAALVAALDRLERPGSRPWRTPLQRVIDALSLRLAEEAA